jgi:hypothetical protein
MAFPTTGLHWREQAGLKWLEGGFRDAKVCFTTRTGGVSEGPYTSLNLGILTGDERESVRENRHRAAAAVGLDPGRVAMGRQVHGADLTFHRGDDLPPHFAEPGAPPEEADGQLTDRVGTGLLVLVADCFPVAMLGGGGLAMLHCGWRGLAAGLIERAAARIGAESAVLDAFAHLGTGISQGRMCDLEEVTRRSLTAAGVGDVVSAGVCTSCDRELFFSHRRDGGVTGRQAGVAWLR